MNVVWTPDPGTPLFVLFETASGPFVWTIQAQIETPEDGAIGGGMLNVSVLRYSGSIKPNQDLLTIIGGDDALTVTAETLIGLFPIVFIDYLTDDGDLKRIDDWDALPNEAREVVEFRPSDLRKYIFTLTAQAELSNGSIETADYSLIVLHDWTPGRDRLVAEVDARRRS